jgi:stress-induced morphogen
MTKEAIAERINQHLKCDALNVFDLTGGGDHYEVHVTSLAFKGLSRIQQQRAVMDIFDAELKSGEIHALSIKTNISTEK